MAEATPEESEEDYDGKALLQAKQGPSNTSWLLQN